MRNGEGEDRGKDGAISIFVLSTQGAVRSTTLPSQRGRRLLATKGAAAIPCTDQLQTPTTISAFDMKLAVARNAWSLGRDFAHGLPALKTTSDRHLRVERITPSARACSKLREGPPSTHSFFTKQHSNRRRPVQDREEAAR